MHILFLIHGMGRQPDNWSKPVAKHLTAMADQYQHFRETSLQEEIIIEPLRYDSVFEDLLGRWKNDFSGIMNSEAGDAIPGGRLEDLMDSMNKDEKQFFWSHVADLLIYRFFPLYRDRVRIEVIQQIAQKVSEYRKKFGGNTRFSFLAHSLGTAVIHDSLHLLGETRWDDSTANVMGPPHTRFQSLFMLANTSRILQSDIKVEDSIVCPVGGHGDHTREYLGQYYNVFHRYDPVTLLWQINGESWGSNFRQVNLAHIRDLNIHDFTHYLSHPAVHIPLLRVLCGFRAVLPVEQVRAIETYNDIDRQHMIREVHKRLESAKSVLGQDSTLLDLVKIWVQMKDLIAGRFEIRS